MYAKAASVISTVTLTIREPFEDDDPDYDPMFPSSARYSVSSDHSGTDNGVIWFDTTDGGLIALENGTDRFESGHSYQVRIYMLPYAGYEFSGQTICMANGKSASCEMAEESGELCVTIDYPVLMETIYDVYLTISPPKAGNSPDYYPSLDNSNCYSADRETDIFRNDVCWFDKTTGNYMVVDQDVFQEGHDYTVYIYLTPANYCQFSTCVYCSVNGETIDNGGGLTDSGQYQIICDFSVTIPIDTVYVTIPEAAPGASPGQPSVPSGSFYSAWGEWHNMTTHETIDSSYSFGENTYAVELYIFPGEGYYFTDEVTAVINGEIFHVLSVDESVNGYQHLQIWLYYDLQPIKDGWKQVGGKWYYYINGNAVTGWKQISSKWYYFNSAGVMQTGWQKIDGKWYHFDKDGYMQTDWIQVGGKWYYLNASGVMQTGWQKIGGKYYYLNASGVMQTGWVQVGGKWYYLNASGVMQTGWQKISNVWYYFNTGGDMATGWKTIGGKTYYFKDSGAMAANEWCKGYWLNADGTWTYKYKASWKKDSKGWYYQDTSGWYAKSCTIKIDGKNYTFDANGYMK